MVFYLRPSLSGLSIAISLLVFSCSANNVKHGSKISDACVEKIDSVTYPSCYIIHLKDHRTGHAMKLLSSKRPTDACDVHLVVGECYKIKVTSLTSTSGFTDGVAYRLGNNNIYENGVLVFAAGDDVVGSNQVSGLCYLSAGTKK